MKRISGLIVMASVAFLLMPYVWPAARAAQTSHDVEARRILEATGVSSGLVVHVGCEDGRLTAALCAGENYLVHGLDRDPTNVEQARTHIQSLGLYGGVSVDRWSGKSLPYIDNLVNLLMVSGECQVASQEITRVLAPGGVAVTLDSRLSTLDSVRKPWPSDIDQWTHYLHGPDNNAVARDTVVGPPRHMQWLAAPRWTRHHDWLSSVSLAVTAGGRLFYVLDEASSANLELPGEWSIVARDAFNGVMLWKRPMESWVWHRQRFRSGPMQVTRLLVASDERVYTSLELNAPVSALDAATGETVATFAETAGAEEIILAGATLLVLKGKPVAEHALTLPSIMQRYGFPNEKTLVAVDTATGKMLWTWTPNARPLPETLASDGKNAYIRLGSGVACLDLRSGEELWRYEGGGQTKRNSVTFGKETLVVADDVVLCNMAGNLTALSAQNGRRLWTCETGTAFHAPVDIFVIDGLVWHRLGHQMDPMRVPPDQREARDLHTGELKVKDSVAQCLLTPGHHYRCYRAKATQRFLIVGKRGVEMMDLDGTNHTRDNWVRGSCQYGVLPANGLLYTPPNSCGCYMEAMLRGFWALAGESKSRRVERSKSAEAARLEKGPAFGQIANQQSKIENPIGWPAYRHDPLRSGVATTAVSANLQRAWSTELGGRLTQPVVAGRHVVLASADAGIVYNVDEETGEVLWQHIAGGRVDSPPTIYEGMVLFGSADGRITCLRLSDGELVWRFLAAPADLRGVAFERLESPWPVHGSLLVLDGVAYCCAGRSTWLDGGLYLYGLDPATGTVLHQNHIKSQHPRYEEREDTNAAHLKGHLWTDYKTFSQPDQSDTYSITGGVSDVMVSDGTHVFLRHLMFNRKLNEQVGRSRQLFSTSSLLDDEEHHRSDWGLGTGEHDRLPAARHKGGFSRFHLNDQGQPAPGRSDSPTGLMLVYQDDVVWGVQRTHRRRTFGNYRLFKKEIAGLPGKYIWQTDLPVRPRAMLKAGNHLFLGVMPIEIPEHDPHAAYEGRLGGAIWVCSEADGSKVAEYPLSSPVTWDGMAAAGGRLYLITTTGQVTCMASSE